MIKQGILNADLRSLTARIGHRDRFAIVDAGYNIPLGIETVDLAFLPNIPSMVQVVEGIINEMAIEEVILQVKLKKCHLISIRNMRNIGLKKQNYPISHTLNLTKKLRR